MTPEMLARIARLDEALAAGRLSRMAYLLRRMQLAEEDAERLIQAHPEGQRARLARQAEDMQQAPPPVAPRRRHWQDD